MKPRTGAEAELNLRWRLGARASALIVQIASKCQAAITVSHADQQVNAKSMMELMMLGSDTPDYNDVAGQYGLKPGAHIKLAATGRDAQVAIKKLTDLLQNDGLLEMDSVH